MAKIFKDGVATGNPGNNYYQYITPAYIGFLSKTARPLAVGQVGLELKKFVNTLELPSENEFYFTLGYNKTINGVEHAFYMESFVQKINMEQPSFSKMEITPKNTDTLSTDREVGKKIILQVDYRIQNPFKAWSVFEIQLQKLTICYQFYLFCKLI